MRYTVPPLLIVLACSLPAQVPSLGSSPRVAVLPEAPWIERGKSQWHVNFDFRFTNPGATPAQLDLVSLRVLDSSDALVLSRYVDRGGTAPGLDTMLPAPIPAGETRHAFNPYHSFELDVEIARLEYKFRFRSPNGRLLGVVNLTIEPQPYETKAALHLPVQGRVLVRDGHDFLSHHRRVGFDFPDIRRLGLTTNTSRYGYDMVLVDEAGSMFESGGRRLEDWYGWETPILAPAAGRIVALENDFPDNTLSASGAVQRNPRVTPTNLDTFAGNYVVIDHGDGEYSLLGHMRAGSVPVELGQEVARGDVVGAMGLSGASDHVHLHYQLQDGSDLWDAEGLPGPFRNYLWHLGSKSRRIEVGQIDTGDVVEALPGR